MTDPVIPRIPPLRVLVVDDEMAVRLALVRSLTLLGYSADAASSGYQALGMLENIPYDVLVLDIRMPDIDGIEVMVQARRIRPDLRIIILTGHATLESAIAAVKSRAVDYLLKPVSVHDIDAVIVRSWEHAQEDPLRTPSSERFLCVGPVTLDQGRLVVSVAGVNEAGNLRAKLTISESALLIHLMRHPGTIFSCRELAQAALGYDVSEEEAQRIVRPHISRLRRKVESDPDHPRLIRAASGQGYFFAF